ncbi:hypothetical protein [Scytonema sp. NUACC21]
MKILVMILFALSINATYFVVPTVAKTPTASQTNPKTKPKKPKSRGVGRKQQDGYTPPVSIKGPIAPTGTGTR